ASHPWRDAPGARQQVGQFGLPGVILFNPGVFLKPASFSPHLNSLTWAFNELVTDDECRDAVRCENREYDSENLGHVALLRLVTVQLDQGLGTPHSCVHRPSTKKCHPIHSHKPTARK